MGQATKTITPWATAEDWEVCRALHRRFGTTYYFSTQMFPKAIRPRVHALYGFVRVPDEWVDNSAPLRSNAAERLANYRKETLEGFRGNRPGEPVLRAFLDVARECGMTPTEPLLFLDAMESDLTVTRYPTYADLERYMRGSASAVGLMLCDIMGVERTASITEGAMALGEAMQLTNFLRDIGEDLDRGRIYLPLEDMDRFGVTEEDMINRRKSAEFISLIDFEISRARRLYEVADRSIPELPRSMQRAVRLSRVLYSRILDRIVSSQYEVFRSRARTSPSEKIGAALSVILSRK